MTENVRRRPHKISMNLCYRIECLCELNTNKSKVSVIHRGTMKDRRIVEEFYCFYRKIGDSETTALRKAKANAIRVILTEELT